MSQYGGMLTNIGLAAYANAQLTGEVIALTHIAVGDGANPPVQSATALQNEVWRAATTRIGVSATDNNVLEIDTVLPAVDGGFTLREIGVFDADGNLFAIGNVPESYIPSVAEGSAIEVHLRLKVVVGNTAQISLTVDPGIIMATRAYAQDLNNVALIRAAQARMAALTEQQYRLNTQYFT